MIRRIAPTNEFPTHFEASIYLNQISTYWKLREIGESHELTPSLLAEWQGFRGHVSSCNYQLLNVTLRYEDMERQLKHGSHQDVIEFVDDLISRLQKEYEYTKPTKPLVFAHDIERLRRCINELDECRESLIKY